MFGTHTIRRKLLLGLGGVCLMLLVMSIGGIRGLMSYRAMVRNIEFAVNDAPHQSDLVAALTRLFEPLSLNPAGEEALKLQRRQFLEQVDKSREAIAEFIGRLEKMPLSELPDAQSPITKSMLIKIDEELCEMGHQVMDPNQVEDQWPKLPTKVGEQLVRAHLIPDPVVMSGTLEKARGDYRKYLIIVWATGAATLVLFLVLAKAAHRVLFVPITALHQGARRVAQGDFDYRVRLNTRDEMSELAHSFNQMTSRFQEVAHDLETQVQERSRQLVRSERLAGVGFLAAGVAHEINNPLSAISMAAESLESRLTDALENLPPADVAVVRQYLGMMQTEAERCRQITARLLDFSRGRDSTRTRTDVSHIVTEVVEMVQFLSKYRDKKIEFSSVPCFAEVNAPEIKQVILNLVANGLEAMEVGGTLRIEAAEQTDHVLLKFTDEGCGMTADIVESIFEPFFTQKRVGQGTGLGLSISHRIVSEHGGTISAGSPGPGQGSTFTVRLPRKAAAIRDIAA